jgi:hypothetical protein
MKAKTNAEHFLDNQGRIAALVVWSVVILIGTFCFAQENEPSAIFKKVTDKYQSMETYSAVGTIISEVDHSGSKMNIETSFSIKMKKPHLYLISWDQQNSMMPGGTQSGAVWNDGSQPYLYMGIMKAYSKMSSDEMALGAATGISGGAAFTIPSLFLSVFTKRPAPFARLIDPKLTGSEQVEGDACYVITGSSSISKTETFWISKKTYMIRKYSRSFEPPEGGAKVPKITDQQLEEAVKAMGQEVTEARKDAMRNMRNQIEDSSKTAKLKGVSTEIHTKIDTSELKGGNFAFPLPLGTVLKESLFGGMLNTRSGQTDPQTKAGLGQKIDAKEASDLESVVAQHPDDLSARTKLLDYYFMTRFTSAEAKERHQKHVLWIIKNRPETEIAGRPCCGLDAILEKDGYNEGKQLWLEQTQAHPQNATILGHAAQFVFIHDKALAEDLLKQAQKVDPNNPQWSERLGHLYSLQTGKDTAAKSLAEYEKAQAADSSEMSRFYRLAALAKSAFEAGAIEQASQYANELLKAAQQYPKDWNYGNAIHHGNNVLGRIALKQGQLKQADEYLLKAGQTPGSPQLNSFGPNMSLAKELLEKGEKDTVLRYFELCRKFWSMGGEILDSWTKEVKAGKVPSFGGTLKN